MDLALPEIRRRWDAECTPARLGIGVVTAFVVGASVFSLTLQLGADKFDCYWVCLHAAMILLLGYGTIRVAGSVGEERRQGTWDLMRLTPLSALEISLGKFLGAPLYAMILAAALVPWLALSAHGSPEAGSVHGLPVLVEFACMTFGAWSLALMVSALADERLGNNEGTRFVLMILIIPLVSMTLSRVTRNVYVRGEPPMVQLQTFAYYGWTVSSWAFDSLSWLAFGAWAFEAARWRIAVDKLEPLASWRISAFILFLVAYFLGLPSIGIQTVIVFPYIAFLLSSLAEPWTAGQWRLWLSKSDVDRLTQAPVWMRGAATFALAAAAFSFIPYNPADPSGVAARRFPLLLCFFALRDIFFLQWCRLKVRKSPEIVAVVYIALAYGLPAMITGVSRAGEFNFLFSAMTKNDLGFFLNVLPGLAQAALAACVLARAVPDRPIK